MAALKLLLLALHLTGRAVAGSITSNEMGPAAFLWPPDRVWSAALDNTPPCGSSASVGNRTSFPLTGGLVALVDQAEGFDLQLSVSYSGEPRVNSDFSVLISSAKIAELDPGHTCVSVPDAPSNIKAGTNATLQIIYTSVFDSPSNETFYACADITYVLASAFTERVPCFNATESPDSASTSGGSKPTASPVAGSSSGLSGGAIAGIVVGSVAGVGLIAGAAFWVYRDRQRKRRTATMEQSRARAVKWDETRRTSQSASQNSVPLRDL